MDYYIKRAAVAVANNNRLEVATKYQAQPPAEHREKLRLSRDRESFAWRLGGLSQNAVSPRAHKDPPLHLTLPRGKARWILTHEQRKLRIGMVERGRGRRKFGSGCPIYG